MSFEMNPADITPVSSQEIKQQQEEVRQQEEQNNVPLFDFNDDNKKVEKEDFSSGLLKLGFDDKTAQDIFKLFDTDESGNVTEEEYNTILASMEECGVETSENGITASNVEEYQAKINEDKNNIIELDIPSHGRLVQNGEISKVLDEALSKHSSKLNGKGSTTSTGEATTQDDLISPDYSIVATGKIMNPSSEAQAQAITDITEGIDNLYYDTYGNGDIFINFPDGTTKKVDADGNITKIETTVLTWSDGSVSYKSYTIEDEVGNIYTKNILYNKDGSILGSEVSVENKNGQQLKYEEYNGNGLLYRIVNYEYDENNNQIKKTVLKYDKDKHITNKTEQYFENGIYTEGKTVTKTDNQAAIQELSKQGITISEEDALKIRHLSIFADLSTADIAYAVSMGYDKYLDSIANCMGFKYIQNGKATSFIMNDYNKLIETIKNRENVEEAFCPTIDSIDDAYNDLSGGDTCVIDGKLYIKTASGMEQLNMSREKYFELFPPASKYVINQNQSGDCYLLSTMYSMMTNPSTYANLLRCFTENEDGSVTVKIPYKGPNPNHLPDVFIETFLGIPYYPASDITFTIPSNGKMDDFYTPEIGYSNHNGKTYADACEGIRALEYLYGFNVLNANIDSLFEELDKAVQNGDEWKINEINDKIKEMTNRAEDAKGEGGDVNFVFRAFGLKSSSIGVAGLLHTESEEWVPRGKPLTEYSLVGGAFSRNNTSALSDIGESDRHAYAIRPFYDENRELKYEVTNPWNTACSTILTQSELDETFTKIWFGF